MINIRCDLFYIARFLMLFSSLFALIPAASADVLDCFEGIGGKACAKVNDNFNDINEFRITSKFKKNKQAIFRWYDEEGKQYAWGPAIIRPRQTITIEPHAVRNPKTGREYNVHGGKLMVGSAEYFCFTDPSGVVCHGL